MNGLQLFDAPDTTTAHLPLFPIFKPLTIHDKNFIETFTKKYAPYSDYNFVSLWSYNTQDAIEISILHDNLVIKFTDYISNIPFLSFLGKNNLKDTLSQLFIYAQHNHLEQELKLIPDVILSTAEDLSDFEIVEDRDNFDYILSVPELINLQGNKNRGKRNFVNRFNRLYPNHAVTTLDLTDHDVQKDINHLFDKWAENKNIDHTQTATEQIAIKRLLHNASELPLEPLGVYVDTKLVGFSIDEIVQENHGVIHFEKADIDYIGIFQFLKQATAERLEKKGCLYINYEQDLGIDGLRKAKLSWRPMHFLKKYKIRLK